MSMVFPSTSVAPSVATDFVNGIKFDICEVVKEAYNMLSDKRFRYFLCVEDTFIVNYSAAEQYFEKTGISRWDWFCRSKTECCEMIKDYADKCEQVDKWKQLLSKKQGISPLILPKIRQANEYCIKRYGVKIAA